MKIRLKFEKTGALKYIGHLDVMRYFQKLLRRADCDVKFSQGFSPHMEMSFATPLGLGLTSHAEYVDIEFVSAPALSDLIDRMNRVTVPELRILDACILPDDAKNAMSLLAAADYVCSFREGHEPDDFETFFTEFEAFLSKESILTEKQTKKNTVEVDLKKQLKEYRRTGNDIFLKVDTGSSSNLKPELLLETFYRFFGKDWDPFTFEICREELYGEEDGRLIPLMAYGIK